MASTSTKRCQSKLGLQNQCRICLTLSVQNLTLLESPLSKTKDTDLIVLNALEIVVGENISLGNEYPNGICGICLRFLNIAYDLKLTYFKSKQKLLANASSSYFIEEIETDEHFLKHEENNEVKEFGLISHNGDYDHDLSISPLFEENKTDDTKAKTIDKKSSDSYFQDSVTETTKLNVSFINEEINNMIEISERDPISDIVANMSMNCEETIKSDEKFASPIDLIAENFKYDVKINKESAGEAQVRKNVKESLKADTKLKANISDDHEKMISQEQDIQSANQETNFCVYCNRNFDHSDYLRKHRVVCIKFKNLECYVCNTKFKAKKDLINHITNSHLVGKNISGGTTLKVNFKCNACNKVIFGKRKWMYHLATHKEKKVFCDECGKAFMRRSNLDKHMQIHKKEIKVICPVCGKGFHYDSGLYYHMKVHNTNDRKYACSYCSKTFYNLCGKKRHERTHTGEKPYNCRYCNKGFRSQGERKTHEYLHTDERPFHCEICLIGFTKQYNLINHQMVHSGDHQCHICGKGFVNEIVVKHHLRLRHKGNITLDSLPTTQIMKV